MNELNNNSTIKDDKIATIADDNNNLIIDLCLVNFHHTRGPEVEYSVTNKPPTLFPYLPFQALPDGAHSFKQTFTYFTLLYNPKLKTSCLDATSIPDDQLQDYTTVFAISCSIQIDSKDLINKTDDIIRSTVQKSCVVIAKEPIFGQIKDKLSIVTNVYFEQKDFSDKSLLDSLYENLSSTYTATATNENFTLINTPKTPLYLGLCLRRIVMDFQKDMLTILKAILLEKKICFFGNDVEKMCNLQFGFISLIPDLLSNLHDCGSPLLNKNVEHLKIVDHFKSSDKKSIWKFLGYPLQIFGKGGMFSPYTPLQQMDDVINNTAFYMMGTSNGLYLVNNEKEDLPMCDLLINVDKCTVEVLNKKSLPEKTLYLSYQDKKWIENIYENVKSTWNEEIPDTPTNSRFEGSEDYIRNQFEDYLTGLLSTVKLYYLQRTKPEICPMEINSEKQLTFFNMDWFNEWSLTQNYKIFMTFTDDRIFDLFEPKHIYADYSPVSAFQKKFVSTFSKYRRPTISSAESAASNTLGVSKISTDTKNDSTDTKFDTEETRIRTHNNDNDNTNNDGRNEMNDDSDIIGTTKHETKDLEDFNVDKKGEGQEKAERNETHISPTKKQSAWDTWRDYFTKKPTTPVKNTDTVKASENTAKDFNSIVDTTTKDADKTHKNNVKNGTIATTSILEHASTNNAISNALSSLALSVPVIPVNMTSIASKETNSQQQEQEINGFEKKEMVETENVNTDEEKKENISDGEQQQQPEERQKIAKSNSPDIESDRDILANENIFVNNAPAIMVKKELTSLERTPIKSSNMAPLDKISNERQDSGNESEDEIEDDIDFEKDNENGGHNEENGQSLNLNGTNETENHIKSHNNLNNGDTQHETLDLKKAGNEKDNNQ
ncbi:uncharacterized protein SCODWIG_02104 [Saccharomycodes ludwigii]|uniref:UDENN domain-containing protein n=1 Tax=Saccharomycodes ludwigii TaxID=36035 RepID=A0A376B6N0_9ASCO|nr:hypothetical protein SCDLUD_001740 [Saccharomycodes ludwigii]KAH3901954.1 hypothetical protein SCDLUD_001740 [Saccharomycodes ludwigii]SSD60343.1 uncharacterized protein SCODWIG_02104 [Saccharomycodes ludwigii]